MSAFFPEYTDRRRVILEGVIPPASKEVWQVALVWKDSP
jgi:hypothetical protein